MFLSKFQEDNEEISQLVELGDFVINLSYEGIQKCSKILTDKIL